MFLFGKVKDHQTKRPIPGSSATAIDMANTSHSIVARIDTSGRYEFNKFEERAYSITFSAPGYWTKSIEVDLRGPTMEEWKAGYGLNVEITLMRIIPDFDATVLNKPIGKCSFNTVSREFQWDHAYTESIGPGIKRMIADYDARTNVDGK